MRNIKLTLEYDGTRFFGFQKQNKKRTVQVELEKESIEKLNEYRTALISEVVIGKIDVRKN